MPSRISGKKEVVAFGKTFKSVVSLAGEKGVSAAALTARLRRGEKPEDAVAALTPILVNGKAFKTLVAVAEEYNIPAATLRHRIKKLGMTYENAIVLPVKELKTGSVIVEGTHYKSFAAAAKAYGKDPDAARNRMKSGMSAEEAILTPNKRVRSLTHRGKQFASIRQFSNFYGLCSGTVHSRLRMGWSLDDIVNTPVMSHTDVIYRGITYTSISNLCSKLGLPYNLVYKRINSFGWSVEKAVGTAKITGRELKARGKVFQSVSEAADYFDIDKGVLSYRLNAGWPADRAVDKGAEVDNRRSIDIDGEVFESLSDAAREYGLNPVTFMKRVRDGWSNEQAAGLLPPPERGIGPQKISPEDYIRRLFDIHGDNLSFERSVFGKAQDKVEVVCNQGESHQSFWATPNNLLRGKGCPICKISHGARKVARFLDKHKISYEVEWTGHGLRSIEYGRAVLRMDFHLPDNKAVIEFDGVQHFAPQTLGRMTNEEAKEAFEKTKVNDHRKNEWAKANGYKMIRIRYDESVSTILAAHFL